MRGLDSTLNQTLENRLRTTLILLLGRGPHEIFMVLRYLNSHKNKFNFDYGNDTHDCQWFVTITAVLSTTLLFSLDTTIVPHPSHTGCILLKLALQGSQCATQHYQGIWGGLQAIVAWHSVRTGLGEHDPTMVRRQILE